MFDFSDLFSAGVGLALGSRFTYKIITRNRFQHDHVWEVIDKNEQPSPWELGNLKHAKGAATEVLLIRPVVVHYQCMCGESKVERV